MFHGNCFQARRLVDCRHECTNSGPDASIRASFRCILHQDKRPSLRGSKGLHDFVVSTGHCCCQEVQQGTLKREKSVQVPSSSSQPHLALTRSRHFNSQLLQYHQLVLGVIAKYPHTMSLIQSSEIDRDSKASAAPYDQKATRRLRRKIDFHLIPFLALLYLWVPADD